MACKTLRTNIRVEVQPRNVGDFGWARISGPDYQHTEKSAIDACEAIAADIRRHVDGLPSYGSRGVSVLWDNEKVCEHCGSDWSEDSDTYNGGCCSKDEENAPLEASSVEVA